MKVDKNVPMPKTEPRGRPAKYPFATMNVGDSVFFEGEVISPTCRPYICANATGRNHGKKFTGRTVDGGVRIWRIT